MASLLLGLFNSKKVLMQVQKCLTKSIKKFFCTYMSISTGKSFYFSSFIYVNSKRHMEQTRSRTK